MAIPYPTTDDRDRSALRALSRSARGGVLTLSRAARALTATPRAASGVLSGLTRRSWLKRLRRGLYLVLPLEAEALRVASPRTRGFWATNSSRRTTSLAGPRANTGG